MTSNWFLRPLLASDCEAVRMIFNHYVAHSFAAYAEHPSSTEDIQTMLASTQGYPALAADNDDGQLIGFAMLRPYSRHTTFAGTALLTTFIAEGFTGMGLGTVFLAQLEAEARVRGISHILAHISSRNEGSLAFHQRHGYAPCGCFHDIGTKQGQVFDVVWFEKNLEVPAEG